MTQANLVTFVLIDADFQNYRNDPRCMAQARLLEKSSAKLKLLPMTNIS